MYPTRTRDAAPAYDRLDRIETYKRVIDRKKAEIAHKIDIKHKLTEEIREDKAYLSQLKTELALVKKGK